MPTQVLLAQSTATETGTDGAGVRDLRVGGSTSSYATQSVNDTAFLITQRWIRNHGSTQGATTNFLNGSATWAAQVQVDSISGTIEGRFRLERRNSAGVIQSSSAYSSLWTTTGLKTLSTTWNPGTWAAGDRLSLTVEIRRTAGHGNVSINVGSTLDTNVTAQLAPTSIIQAVGTIAETDTLVSAQPVKPIVRTVGVTAETEVLNNAVPAIPTVQDVGTIAEGGTATPGHMTTGTTSGDRAQTIQPAAAWTTGTIEYITCVRAPDWYPSAFATLQKGQHRGQFAFNTRAGASPGLPGAMQIRYHDGSVIQTIGSNADIPGTFTADDWVWLRYVIAPGGFTGDFYYSLSSPATDPGSVSWTQVGTQVSQGAITIRTATSTVSSIGGDSTLTGADTRGSDFSYGRMSLNGSVVWETDFRDADQGWDSPPATDSQGNSWSFLNNADWVAPVDGGGLVDILPSKIAPITEIAELEDLVTVEPVEPEVVAITTLAELETLLAAPPLQPISADVTTLAETEVAIDVEPVKPIVVNIGLIEENQAPLFPSVVGTVEQNSYEGTAVTTISVNKPAGTAIGEVLMIFVANNANTATDQWNNGANKPTGFTFIDEAGSSGLGGSFGHEGAFYRVVDGTEGSSFSVTCVTSSGEHTIWCMRVQDVDLDNVIAAIGAGVDFDLGNDVLIPGFTVTAPVLGMGAWEKDRNDETSVAIGGSNAQGSWVNGGQIGLGAGVGHRSGWFQGDFTAGTVPDVAITQTGGTVEGYSGIAFALSGSAAPSLIDIRPLKLAAIGTLSEAEVLLTVSADQSEPQVINVGTISQSDTAEPIEALKPIIQLVTTLAETDTLITVAVIKDIIEAVGVLAGTDTLISVQAVKPILQAVGLISEAESLNDVDALKPILQAVGLISEAESLNDVEALKPILEAVGQIIETDTAINIEALKPILRSVGFITEADVLQDVSASQAIIQAVTTLAEADTLITIQAIKEIVQAVGLISGTDTLIDVEALKPIAEAVGTITESDVLISTGALKPILEAVTQIVEAETLNAVTVVQPGGSDVGTIPEADSLLAVQAIKDIIQAVGLMTETDTLNPVTVDKAVIVGAISETDTLIDVEALKPIVTVVGTMLETDTLNDVQTIKDVLIGMVSEVETLLGIDQSIYINVGTLSETEVLQAIQGLKPIVQNVGTIGETEVLRTILGILGVPVILYMRRATRGYDNTQSTRSYDRTQTSTEYDATQDSTVEGTI